MIVVFHIDDNIDDDDCVILEKQKIFFLLFLDIHIS